MNGLNMQNPKSPGLISLLELAPYLVLLFLYNYVATVSSSRTVGDIPDLGEVEFQSFESTIVSHTAKVMDEICYIHALDQLKDEDSDPTSYHGYYANLWSINQVTAHC